MSIEIKNFIIFPPEVRFNSQIQFVLSEDISHLFITHGSQTISVRNGANILNLKDSDTFITLHRYSQSMNVSFVTSFIYSLIPDVIEVNHPQSIFIDQNTLLYDLDVSCSGNCDLALDHLPNSTIKVSFTGIEPGSIVLEFYVNYYNSNFYFRIPISVERPPVFELLSPNVVFTSVNSLVFIHSYSHFDLESSFHLMILLLNLLMLSSSPVLIPSLFTDLN
ncbi:hypothetical protein GEMRC1_008222 [Eukaryota sp. GEM-RC1]